MRIESTGMRRVAFSALFWGIASLCLAGPSTPPAGLYIQSRNTLQAGTTFYVSSGTVVGQLTAGTFIGSGAGLTNLSQSVSAGSTNYIQNTGALQSGATAYISSGTIQNLNATNFKVAIGTFTNTLYATNITANASQLNFNTISGGVTDNLLQLDQAGTDEWLDTTTNQLTIGSSDPSADSPQIQTRATESGSNAAGWSFNSTTNSSDFGFSIVPGSDNAKSFINFKSTASADSRGGNLTYLPVNKLFQTDRAWLFKSTSLDGSTPIIESSGTVVFDCVANGPNFGTGLVGIGCRNSNPEAWSGGSGQVSRGHSHIWEDDGTNWFGGFAANHMAWIGDSTASGVSHTAYNPLSTLEVFGNMAIGGGAGAAGKLAAPPNGLSVLGEVVISTMTTPRGQVTIGSPNFGVTPALVLVQGAGQTGDLLDFYNQNGVLQAAMGNNGALTANGVNVSNLNASNITAGVISTSFLPSGTQGIVFSTTTLQSGTTIYVSSLTATNLSGNGSGITGISSSGLSNPTIGGIYGSLFVGLASGTTFQAFVTPNAITLKNVSFTVDVAGIGGSGDTIVCGDGIHQLSVVSPSAATAGTLTTTMGSANLTAGTTIYMRLDSGAATKPQGNAGCAYIMQ